MKTMIVTKRLPKKELKGRQEIEVTVEFRGIGPHSLKERNDLSDALTILVGAWFPADTAKVRVNLNYREEGERK